jgi:hypothetical protein
VFHGRGRRGEVVSIEMPGKMDLRHLRAAGLGPADVARHLTVTQEYLWKVGGMMMVIVGIIIVIIVTLIITIITMSIIIIIIIIITIIITIIIITPSVT